MTNAAGSSAPVHRASRDGVATKGDEPSIGRLVADASRDVSALVQNEIQLAKAELKVSVRNGGFAAGLFGAAAFLMVLATVMLSIAIAYFLHMTGLDQAWCFLIVFGAYAVIAGALAFVGIRKVRKVRPPERAIEQAKETKAALTNR